MDLLGSVQRSIRAKKAWAVHAETEEGYCVAMGAGRGIRRAAANPVCQPPTATRDGVAEVAEQATPRVLGVVN